MWGLCSLCLMLLPCGRCYATTLTLLQLHFRDVIQNPIPYVKHMVLANISIKGWIVHSDVNRFLMALVTFWSSLPTMLKFGIVVSWPVMLRWSYIGEGAYWCSRKLSPKKSWWLPYIFIITVHPLAFQSVNDVTCHCDLTFILRCHQQAFDCIASFVVHLYTMFIGYLLHALTQTHHIHMVEAYRVCSDLSCYLYDLSCLYLVFWVSWCCLSPHVGHNWSTCPLTGHLYMMFFFIH